MKVDEIIGSVERADEDTVFFVWSILGGGFAWSTKLQKNIAKYDTRDEVVSAYDRSNNRDGKYGYSIVSL